MIPIATIRTDFRGFFPDGRHFLFVARGVASEDSAIMVGSLDGDEPRELMSNESQADLRLGATALCPGPDADGPGLRSRVPEMTGEAMPVAEGVLVIPGASLAVFGRLADGVLTFQTGRRGDRDNARMARPIRAVRSENLGDAGALSARTISPDGSRVDCPGRRHRERGRRISGSTRSTEGSEPDSPSIPWRM